MVFHSDKDLFLKDELSKMCEEWMNPDRYTNQILVGILTMVFAYLMRNYSAALETSVSYHMTMPDDFLIMNYMQENLKDISLADVAEYHLSPSEYRKNKNRTLYLDAVKKAGE